MMPASKPASMTEAAQIHELPDDALMARLKQHYTAPQIVEIVSVISLFGWLNRFNDTLSTELDDETLEWAADFGLAKKTGWDPTPHLPETAAAPAVAGTAR